MGRHQRQADEAPLGLIGQARGRRAARTARSAQMTEPESEDAGMASDRVTTAGLRGSGARVSVGARLGELVDVGVSGLLLGPSGSDERVDELTDRLAGIGSELPSFLGGGLILDERAVDAPVDLLDSCERVGGAEYLGAVLRERDVDCRWMLCVDGGEAIGVKTPPQPVIRTR